MNDPEQKLPEYTLEELLPRMQEAFREGKGFWLPVTGVSNYPTLLPDRDSVILEAVRVPLKTGDLPLYRRDNGQFVLHRIVSVSNNGVFFCCGDHQHQKEAVRPEQMIGLVTWVQRKDKQFSVRQTGYRVWVRIWVWLFPCRGPLIRVFHAAGKLRRGLFRVTHGKTNRK